MKFNHLNVPTHWQNYWTRYPEGHTILEALIQWVSQVDDMVDNVNDWNTYLKDFVTQFDSELQATVTNTLSDWQESGFLDIVINEALDTKYHEMDERLTLELEQKADKGALAQLATTKRDKDVEITMTDLSQDVKEAFTGGSVAVVGEASVGTTNLKDNTVTNDKITADVLANTPWKNSPEDDANYILDEGHTLISGNVQNNPFPTTTLLTNKRAKTSATQHLAWITQTATNATSTSDGTIYTRQLQFNTTTLALSFKTDWKRILNEHDFDLKKLTERGIFLSDETYDVNDYLDNGTYIVSSSALNNPFNSGTSILENVTSTTSPGAINHWVQQTLTNFSGGKVTTYKRVVYINADHTIDYIMGWTKLLDEDDLNLVNPWNGKKWVALGTSMTMVDNSYFDYVQNSLGLIGENRGHSGGGITTSAGAGNTTMQEIESLEDFKGLLTIEVGPNDGGHPLGALGDTTTDTFYGCLYQAFSKAQQNTTARIVVLTMASQWADTGTQDRRDVVTQWTQFAVTRQHTRQAILDMATWFSLPVVDVQGESGMGGWVQNPHTSYDHIHPTKLGGDMIGMYIAKQLQSRVQPFPDELKLYNEV